MSSSAPASPCGNHNGQQQGGVVHGGLSESDSDDDNSLGSVPRSSNAGSPPGEGTTPKLRRKLSKRSLFRRRKSKVDPLASSGSKGTASAADGSSPADGSRPAASLQAPARRGLFRRRRSNGHHHNGEGAGGQPRPLSRASSGGGGGVGLSLSDTDSRPRATIAVCDGGGISSSAHSGVRARGSPEGSGLLSKSDLSRTGGSGGWVGALASGGGGRESSPPSSVYPAPRPLHRIRSSGDDGMGLSQDPNFFPPIPLAEDGCSEKPSSRGERGCSPNA
ncbi:unnamed protein product [Ectocarpus sp. 13 AM-2016]